MCSMGVYVMCGMGVLYGSAYVYGLYGHMVCICVGKGVVEWGCVCVCGIGVCMVMW